MPLTRRGFVTTAVALAPALWLARGAGPATAQSVTAADAPSFFRVEAQPGTDRKGRPIVWGYVHLYRKGQGSARVRLLVESLDAGGQPVASEIAYLDSEVLLWNRTYFEVRPQRPASTYRVTVHSADWTKMGGL
ncbi:MAG TPA: hypothetical protein VJU81_25845 [Methylomirabilota bacterium]|nr:hypothetical protein [Methylomirabilota bacterium]